MNPAYRKTLLKVLAGLDRMQTDAEAILHGPRDAEITALADELRELIVEMQAKVEEKLERGAEA